MATSLTVFFSGNENLSQNFAGATAWEYGSLRAEYGLDYCSIALLVQRQYLYLLVCIDYYFMSVPLPYLTSPRVKHKHNGVIPDDSGDLTESV